MSHFSAIITPYISSEKMDELLDQATSNPEFTARGSNSQCFLSGDYAVLKTNNIEAGNSNFNTVIDDLDALSADGVNVARILGYAVTEFGNPYDSGVRYDSGYIVQERAKGRELLDHKRVPMSYDPRRNTPENRQYVLDYCTMLKNAPQWQFNRFMRDLKAITDKKIMVDPSKLTNFFYDENEGFSFIDLNFRTKERLFDVADLECNQTHRDFLHSAFAMIKEFPLYTFDTKEPMYSPAESEHIKVSMCVAFEKLAAAAGKVGVLPADIEDYFRDQKNPSSFSAGFSLYGLNSPAEISAYTRDLTK